MSNPKEFTKDDFCRDYDLVEARKHASTRSPAPHQQGALRALAKWYKSSAAPKGGILALPTGAGKTFTAVRFLSTGPLSDGCKVLWLAHTHHLLDQAYFSFAPAAELDEGTDGFEIGLIREPRRNLKIRVVSNSVGYYKVHQITKSDDIVIGTLQTIVRAFEDKKQKGLHDFLKSSEGKLVIVFDEAHHAPAPSYRRLMLGLQGAFPKAAFLGLTATPTYSDERKIGWLKKVFPQSIIHQAVASDLIAAGVLSRPIFEQANTNVVPEFDPREFELWVNTYRDLPEDVIDKLARNRERNAQIVDAYMRKKSQYGKTLMFADRWFQCDQLREMLRKRGVRADVVYSHIDTDPGSVEKRNARDKNENMKVLHDFKNNKLDVLINVRMLTEGTDVPSVQSVFLTRQTTSSILLTQMIGRALRGPKFGGTERAYIVSFIDNWKQAINWAGYDQIGGGMEGGGGTGSPPRPPMQLISIELVRQLARMLDEGISVSPASFSSMMPVGWYRCEYLTSVNGDDEMTESRQLVMIMEGDEQHYITCVADMLKKKKESDAAEHLSFDSVEDRLLSFEKRFFGSTEDRIGGTVVPGLFHILRHIGQHGQAPDFFGFEERKQHDLDALAEDFSFKKKLDVFALDSSLRAEYTRKSRFWNVFYYNYEMFKTQYDACVNRLLMQKHHGGVETKLGKVIRGGDTAATREPSEEIKEQVKRRDGYRCLCCGEDTKRLLQIDHIAPAYYGGSNSLENLQTLCARCNQWKATNELNFTTHTTDLQTAPGELPDFRTPDTVRDAGAWEQYLRMTLNTFYRCSAVESIRIGGRGNPYYHWEIKLYAGNPASWVRGYGRTLVRRINNARTADNVAEIESITVSTPGKRDVVLK
ncbi:MAG: DEAD/DEAH box helicase family protein [Bacteroidota bacterium]